MKINRTLRPPLHPIEKVDFKSPAVITKSGLKVYHMSDVPNETTRFDIYFNAGKIEGNNVLASIVNGLLLSGTKNKTSNEINSEINALGAYYESGVTMENAVVSIYCLKENLYETVEIVQDAILNVEFPQKEIDELLNERKQNFLISMEKVSFNAQREFQKQLFSSDKRYNSITELEHFNDISRDDVISFHDQHYINGLEKLVIVSDLKRDEVYRIIDLFSSFKIGVEDHSSHLVNQPDSINKPMKNALQSAIRVGRILFTKEHEDYLDFLILNTIIGDYFGSRLMKNIREDKGYTYGIGSMISEFKKTGYFLIATEVGKEVKEDALNQIKLELERLQTEPVPEYELELVRNYMLGQLLKSADGPYAMIDLFLSVEIHGKSLDFYNEAIHRIQNIRPERIMELAKKYLNWKDLTVVTAG